jgi:hypothetical protein
MNPTRKHRADSSTPKSSNSVAGRPIKLRMIERQALADLISCGVSLSNVLHNITQDPGAEGWRPVCREWHRKWDHSLASAHDIVSKITSNCRTNTVGVSQNGKSPK